MLCCRSSNYTLRYFLFCWKFCKILNCYLCPENVTPTKNKCLKDFSFLPPTTSCHQIAILGNILIEAWLKSADSCWISVSDIHSKFKRRRTTVQERLLYWTPTKHSQEPRKKHMGVLAQNLIWNTADLRPESVAVLKGFQGFNPTYGLNWHEIGLTPPGTPRTRNPASRHCLLMLFWTIGNPDRMWAAMEHLQWLHCWVSTGRINTRRRRSRRCGSCGRGATSSSTLHVWAQSVLNNDFMGNASAHRMLETRGIFFTPKVTAMFVNYNKELSITFVLWNYRVTCKRAKASYTMPIWSESSEIVCIMWWLLSKFTFSFFGFWCC